VSSQIQIMDYDPLWPAVFRRETDRIRTLLGRRALQIEHIGSTSVPGLAAKPIIDILLVVADSSDEPAYVPILERVGYSLRIRESNWHEHRMFKGPAAGINLHVFSSSCPEINRVLNFRDWLRSNAADRDLYERTKRDLSENKWANVDDYADAKTAIIEEILARTALKS
jgi:GrpB-like predicted nucleotidyltransferase (UPF0157 family)